MLTREGLETGRSAVATLLRLFGHVPPSASARVVHRRSTIGPSRTWRPIPPNSTLPAAHALFFGKVGGRTNRNGALAILGQGESDDRQ